MQESLRQQIIDIINDTKCNSTADCDRCFIKQKGACTIYNNSVAKADKILGLIQEQNLSQIQIEAKKDAPAFAKLSDDERALFTIDKMKQFTERFGVGNSTKYSMEYFSSLSKEIGKND